MNIAVYCGSRMGDDEEYAAAAVRLGQWICQAGHGMVYGGGNIGLMGLIADTVLEEGGAVTGVIPEFLIEAEVGHEGLHTLEVVRTMTERKNRMIELSGAFIAMPGGTGTLEEIAEVISLQKLGLQDKPCVFYNIKGFYEPLRQMLADMVAADFLTAEDFRKIHFISRPEDLDQILG
ncbi:MAG: TIGR00730 family Rossman fold protein [Firmicutes bacterium]|nr:TIGR00730 family Rossman fold protein [Bacillota bacterium]